ncbi:NAD-dependent epimerase/dehydratase family protein [Exiguobacterium oxidotolerans]|uniref:NAD-dependent epimerase/dehydratase family protein n=1 Tax=Exiguobacterium oxidotolerans TaxID=223958 RepID=UPI0004946AF9|nr:NAD-dependent epimerase/dehydratase family protein [Exiguobacterium oxidotolerans]
MKKVLVTSKNGYISKKIVEKFNKELIMCEAKSVRNQYYNEINFDEYSTVIHTAAIVHKNDSKNKFAEINSDLTFKIAKDCKSKGCKLFIFISTMNVFGQTNGVINSSTEEKPITLYGESKLNAEKKILSLEDDNFKIAIVRPPMVYGAEAPGNYKNLVKLSKILYIFPSIKNKRSMIFIDNLTHFIYELYKAKKSGVFHPQNSDYICTTELVLNLRKEMNKKTILLSFFNPLVRFLIKKNSYFEKIFGDLYYDQEDFKYDFYESPINFEKSIVIIESENIKNENGFK